MANKKREQTSSKQHKGGRRVGSLKFAPTKTDRPEFIKSLQLSAFHPFTIYHADGPREGDYGPRIFFHIAYRPDGPDGEVVKRIWTPSATDERVQLMREVKRGPVVGCRLIEVPTTGKYDMWKVIDVDDDPDEVIKKIKDELAELDESPDRSGLEDDDIPF